MPTLVLVVFLVLSSFLNAANATLPLPLERSPYFTIVALGSDGDTARGFPHPMVVLDLLDTTAHSLRVRFTGLGILADQFDTVDRPTVWFDTVAAYRAAIPLYQVKQPETSCTFYVDVVRKADDSVIDSRVIRYTMTVKRFAQAKISSVHQPTTGLGNPLLRRRFRPDLLPLTIETNPGWQTSEQIDSTGVYALVFTDPTAPTNVKLTVTVRASALGSIDSAAWEGFKQQARVAFGSKGIAVNSLGDFLLDDPKARVYLPGGYEFVTKSDDGRMEYVAAYATPNAVILLLAPLSEPSPSAEYEYFRAIARSFSVK